MSLSEPASLRPTVFEPTFDDTEAAILERNNYLAYSNHAKMLRRARAVAMTRNPLHSPMPPNARAPWYCLRLQGGSDGDKDESDPASRARRRAKAKSAQLHDWLAAQKRGRAVVLQPRGGETALTLPIASPQPAPSPTARSHRRRTPSRAHADSLPPPQQLVRRRPTARPASTPYAHIPLPAPSFSPTATPGHGPGSAPATSAWRPPPPPPPRPPPPLESPLRARRWRAGWAWWRSRHPRR